MNKDVLRRVGFCSSLALTLLIMTLSWVSAEGKIGGNKSDILLLHVYPDALAANDKDEAVALVNVSDAAVDISGWGLSDTTDNLLKLTFPENTMLEAGASLWVTKDREMFKLHFGFDPDIGLGEMQGSWPGFSNSGDEVLLSNSAGVLMDALVYEGGGSADLTSSGAWEGEPLEFYELGAAEGQIFSRKIGENGLLVSDSNSAADWIQDKQDPIRGRRVAYPGWDLEQFANTVVVQQSAVLTVAIAPDNAYAAIDKLIQNSQESIWIETQTFESHDILESLKGALDRGVAVKILLEGGPPGGIDDSQRFNCFQLEQAGGECYAMVNESSERVFDRYTFLHAKFMIIDGKIGVIGSDNLSPNSWPADAKNDGTFGRRGVVLITDAAGVIGQLQTVFERDLDLANHHDITRWLPVETGLGLPVQTYIPQPYENGISYTVGFADAVSFEGDFEFEVIQSPENFMNPDSGLLRLLDDAGMGDTILVQQQYERLYWGSGKDPILDPNVRLAGYVGAARRGSQVRIMLDSYFDQPSNSAGNWATCDWVNGIAKVERLDMSCQIGNPTGLGIHNKMVLAEIDGRGYVHVGSINGSEQAAKGNREMALQVQSDEAYRYLETMFKSDFVIRTYLPSVLNMFETPADYPLISEVLYNPFGSTDGAEFVEIVNPSGSDIDISGYSLADAVTPDEFADLRRFPAGTKLGGNQIIVVAQQAVEFEAEFFKLPDFEILDSHPDVAELTDDLSWGDPATFLRLGNSGDVIFFRDAADRPVDVLVYGNKIVDGYPTCDATTVSGASLRRNPFNYDTDSCTDFEEWGSPTPGEAP